MNSTTPTIVIEPSRGRVALKLDELWEYRELLYFLVWRDVKVRYKQTALGAGWAVFQPFMTMVVFSVFFGALAGMPSDGVPYPLFALAGLVPWTYFSTALGAGGASVVSSQQLISKVYFPRLLVPLASVATPLVDLAIALVIVFGLMAWYGRAPTANVVWLPALLLLAVATALASSLWLSALHVRFRDVRYVLPFVTQFWLFATPVAYPASLVPERWRALYGLNPMAGVVEGFRWALLGTPAPGVMTLMSLVVVASLLATGLLYFRRLEGTFADAL